MTPRKTTTRKPTTAPPALGSDTFTATDPEAFSSTWTPPDTANPTPAEASPIEGTEFLRQFRAGASSGHPFLAEVDGVWYSIAVTDPPGDNWLSAQGQDTNA